jgi:hypothetical protein
MYSGTSQVLRLALAIVLLVWARGAARPSQLEESNKVRSNTTRRSGIEPLEPREMLSATRQLFDFGSGPSAGDYAATAVQVELYDSVRGYGWLNSDGLTLQYSPRLTDDLRNDSVLGSGPGESKFRIDVANGDYDLRVVLGDAESGHDSMQVTAEGEAIGEVTTTTNVLFTQVTQRVSVADGALELAFSALGEDGRWSVTAIELIPVAQQQSGPTDPTSRLPGDYNLDGRVNNADLGIVASAFGHIVEPFTGADGSGNGIIDAADYAIWRAHRGETLPPIVHPHHPHQEPIPEFAESPTNRAIASGDWSNADVWSAGHAPTATDIVTIDEGMEIQISDANAVADRLVIHGMLRFATDQVTQLRVSTVHVDEHGSLIIGTEDTPVTANARLVIRDTPIDFAIDPEQYGTGLLVEGTLRIHGLAKTSFERLSVEPLAGTTQLVFAAPVTGWQAGDRLFLADTRQLQGIGSGATSGSAYVPESEYAQVARISSDGLTVTLAEPLKFDHRGARDGDGVLAILPHAANVTRNVTITSENPAGTRGHALFTGRANVDVRYADFENLGRTTSARLDSTTFNADNTVKHIGTNQIGRYAIHVHHLDGPETPQNNGYQYTLVGNVSNGGGSELHDFKWGLALHDSHYGLTQDNVITNWAGSGLVTEDGTESLNVIDHNFVARIWGIGGRADKDINGEISRGTGIWLSGVNNIVTNNVVANVFSTTSGGVAGFQIFNRRASIEIPTEQGSDETTVVNNQDLPILKFDGNEAYGTMDGGLGFWNIGAYSSKKFGDGSPDSWIRNFTAWHFINSGAFAYPSERVHVDGLTLFGDYYRFRDNIYPASVGYTVGDYTNAGAIIRHANIQNLRLGINPSTVTRGQSQTFEDSYLRNEVNIAIKTMYFNGGVAGIDPRVINLDNIVFAAPSVPVKGRIWKNIDMVRVGGGDKGVDVIESDEVFVTSYNGVAGDDFRVYYYEQHPDYIVPQTTVGGLRGSPRAGLTNQENMDQFGIAIAGAVAPSLETRPGINGFVAAMDGTPLGLEPQPPVIVGLTHEFRVETNGSIRITFRWLTNRPTTFVLQEAITGGVREVGTTPQIVHEVSISNILPTQKTFRFVLEATDQYGSSSTLEQFDLPRLEAPAPEITRVKSLATNGSAIINWLTHRIYSQTIVEYGADTTYGKTVSSELLETSHAVTLDNLAPLTTYHFRIHAIDIGGVETISEDFTLVTPAF